jgi:hypothetical protein
MKAIGSTYSALRYSNWGMGNRFSTAFIYQVWWVGSRMFFVSIVRLAKRTRGHVFVVLLAYQIVKELAKR